jgi:hypothetical protein
VTKGYITPRASWPRPATPTDLTPAWAGEFATFDDWVSKATVRLTGAYCPLVLFEIPAICIDNVGRRCTMGAHFMRARDEGTFPVRFFWDFAPAPSVGCMQPLRLGATP